ncbi:MAG: AAA family ATPase [Gammaproteobacteria bacterium]|nr:AAA family ATPase [Gammaproteobacteria bacterium]
MSREPVPPESLYRVCDTSSFDFETTADIGEIHLVVGQDRAVESIQFGMRMASAGYNVFVLGPDGIGKLGAVRHILATEAASRPVADGWCYVNNFEDPQRPCALRLPAGRARRLASDVDHLVDELVTAIPAAFHREEYQARKAEIEEEFQERQHQAVQVLREEAMRQRIALLETPTGFAFAPLGEDGEAINPMHFRELAETEQAHIRETIESLQDRLQKTVSQFPAWFRETREKLKALQRETAQFAVDNLVKTLVDGYHDAPAVLGYLRALRADVIEHAGVFLASGEEGELVQARRNHALAAYKVNVVVDNGEATTAPVVVEDLPSYGNLIGRIEHMAQMGTLITDFTLIRAGALHRANGGYLVLDARKLLTQPFAWEGLKRALNAREIRIESIERTLSLLSTVSLEPEPIPLAVKVVLYGDRMLYYLLAAADPEFADLFKVSADFEDRIERSADSDRALARVLGTVARRHDLRPLDRAAVAAVIEHGARLTQDAGRVTLHLRSLADLVHESDHWAAQAGRGVVTATDVRTAIDRQRYRTERLRKRAQEEIRRGTLLIATAGATVGQVNGLSVVDLGNFSFGQPARITATTRLGEGDVLDIERETELGGPIHSKGVLILTGFFASRYGRGYPLSLSASLVFEQSYGQIEGDSASLAELCALVSALAQVPIRQCYAVTGSVNQLGDVQAIGGVNDKIEGFFDVCAARGLDGSHGVLVPAANVQHLMLREDVVEAARAGRFAVYAVRTFDEAIAILTDLPAGARDETTGSYPAGSVNALIEAALGRYSHQRREFGQNRDGD